MIKKDEWREKGVYVVIALSAEALAANGVDRRCGGDFLASER